MQELTLILEGGALRSVYTSGVLDVLMKYKIEANYILGVSAGALTGMNYVSKQPKRSAEINIEYCDNPRYIGIKAFSGKIKEITIPTWIIGVVFILKFILIH